MMFWPFTLFVGKSRQRKQREQSIERLIENSARQRHAAKVENDQEANRAIMAAEHRMRQGRPLRDMLDGMIDRQREDRLAEDHR